MCQANVIKVLSKKDKWMNAEEIAQKLRANVNTIRANLQTLYKIGEIFRMQQKNSNYKIFVYRLK